MDGPAAVDGPDGVCVPLFVDGFVGALVDGLVDGLVGVLVDGFVGVLVVELVDGLVGVLVVGLVDGLVGVLVDGFVGVLVGGGAQFTVPGTRSGASAELPLFQLFAVSGAFWCARPGFGTEWDSVGTTDWLAGRSCTGPSFCAPPLALGCDVPGAGAGATGEVALGGEEWAPAPGETVPGETAPLGEPSGDAVPGGSAIGRWPCGGVTESGPGAGFAAGGVTVPGVGDGPAGGGGAEVRGGADVRPSAEPSV